MDQVIRKKNKNRKAPGPDEIPMEFFKELSEVKREILRNILNDWWIKEDIPEEQLQARVVLIFKKGDSSNWGNFRPISLLNSTYKIIAAMLQRRIAEKINGRLQQTQYGFRKKKSTAQAIHIIRRLIEAGERADQRLYLMLLDWEKAFDRVSQERLFEDFN